MFQTVWIHIKLPSKSSSYLNCICTTFHESSGLVFCLTCICKFNLHVYMQIKMTCYGKFRACMLDTHAHKVTHHPSVTPQSIFLTLSHCSLFALPPPLPPPPHKKKSFDIKQSSTNMQDLAILTATPKICPSTVHKFHLIVSFPVSNVNYNREMYCVEFPPRSVYQCTRQQN